MLTSALALAVPAFAQASGDGGQCPGDGEAPTPVEVHVTSVPIAVASTTDHYFVLYARHGVDQREIEQPVLVKLGEAGTTTLAENVAPLSPDRYRVEKYLVDNPADVDGDCTDDITELSNLGAMNPVNAAAPIELRDGAVVLQDKGTFDALQTFGTLKFILVDWDTDRPSVYFINSANHPLHATFLSKIGLEGEDYPARFTKGVLGFGPDLLTEGGGPGVYYFDTTDFGATFEEIEMRHSVLAASIPFIDGNLAFYIRTNELLYYQDDLESFRASSRVGLVLEEDLVSATDFLPLNSGEGYGRLQNLNPGDRPHPREVVIYEALPNELPRVAGVISTVPQTPLSHVNLRAVQDGIPNAFIRNALGDGDIGALLGGFVRYKVAKDGWELRAATPEEVEAHYESSRPTHTRTPERDLSVREITPLSQIGFNDWKAFGVKAANVAVLRTLGFPEGTVPNGFAIPFYFYDTFMNETPLGEEKVFGKKSAPEDEKFTLAADVKLIDAAKAMLAHSKFRTDFEIQDEMLDDLRDAIKDATSPQWMVDALTAMHATYPEGQSLRYRSSTNNEDLPGFNGAGLYDSKTQHADETEEDGIDKSFKQVLASLWTFRAFTEREFHRIDHLAAAMGVLVHPNYSDELANGVAVSFDPINSRYNRYYVNTQVGEDLVTNPQAHSVPEELLLDKRGTHVLATSNQVSRGQLIMSEAQLQQLHRRLSAIHDHFEKLYNPSPGDPFAMEIEFKITSDDILAIKQARPWVFRDSSTSPPAPSPPPSTGGGGGGGGGFGGGGSGGGGLLFPPQAPAALAALPGDGAVRLEWSFPESDGGAPILRYEYRLKPFRGEFGEWTPVPDSAPDEVNASGYTVTGLDNGTVYVIELRAVNLVDEGPETEPVEVVMPLNGAFWSNFSGEDLEGGAASLEWTPFGGMPRSLRVRFAAGLRFEESELNGEGKVTVTRMGSYEYRYIGQRTGELRLDYDGGESCELRMTYGGVGMGSYGYRCGGAYQGQGRFRLAGLNRMPEITGAGQFEVVENTTQLTRLEAVDPDEEDRIAGYGIAGGADGARFAVNEETGELGFRAAPDYENPADAAGTDPESGGGDNEYVVLVEVRSGEGERERRGERAIRVRVSDEEEPPGAPPAPEVTPEGTESLKVSWREPENRGPAITGYDVRFREEGGAGYRDGGQQGTGLTLRLADLEEGTLYRVQVRAVNQEGAGEWSVPGEGRTDREEPAPDDPSNFTGADLGGRRLTLRLTGEEGTAGSLELRFGDGNRFEQTGSGAQVAASRTEGTSRTGAYGYEREGHGRGNVRLNYDDGASCELRLSFTDSGVGGFTYDCGEGAPAEGSFRLTTGSLFVPVILSAAGRSNSFFTSELTLTNRGDEMVKLDYTYTADTGGGSGTAVDVLGAGMQRIETDALTYLRGLGAPIPEWGDRIGTLRVEVKLGSEVEAVARTTTLVPEGRAGLAYPGVAEEEGLTEPVYLCGLRQNGRDRSNVAFQNMGAAEEGAITLRTTVYSGAAGDATARVLEDVKLEPGGFHQYSGLLGRVENGYVKVERVEGSAPFYAYGVINDQANSDGSFVFPVTAGSLEGKRRQTLPVIVETRDFNSELTVTNFSQEPRRLEFEFVSEQIKGDAKRVEFGMELNAREQVIVPELVEALRRQGLAGLGRTRGFYLGPLFVRAEEEDLSGIVVGARTGSEGGGGQYSVFYTAVPEGEGFTRQAWVEGLQQNEENRSNLALVNTGEVDDSPSIFHLEIYNGETGMLEETVVTKPVPARGWHQIDGILLRSNPEAGQGYIRIDKVMGENPFLAYGVVNDGGAPGERSGDGAYLPARE